MKSVSVLALSLCLIYVTCGEEYDTKGVDVEEILQNDRLLQNYINCVLEKGSCTPEGEQLKSHIREALEDGCAKCNDTHKEGIKKVITFLVKEKKEVWDELQAKYDPEGNYKEKYADLLKDIE